MCVYIPLQRTGSGLNAMHVACIRGKADVLQLLISRAEDHLHKKSLKDILNGKTKVVSVGPASNLYYHCLIFSSQDKWTPLMYAVKNGHTEVVQLLLEQPTLDTLAINGVSIIAKDW